MPMRHPNRTSPSASRRDAARRWTMALGAAALAAPLMGMQPECPVDYSPVYCTNVKDCEPYPSGEPGCSHWHCEGGLKFATGTPGVKLQSTRWGEVLCRMRKGVDPGCSPNPFGSVIAEEFREGVVLYTGTPC